MGVYGMKCKKGILLLLSLILTMGVTSMDAFGLFGFGGTQKWKEEVLLHDGQKVIVQRAQTRGGRHELGQEPPIKEQSVTFTLPAANKSITWKDEFSKDVGHSNFELLALHILNGTPYIVASPDGCLAYNKWGRPNPPYIFFRSDGKAWQRISLSELPAEFNNINLVINTLDHEKELVSLGLASAESVMQLNNRLKQKQYKTIIRTPLKPGATGVSYPQLIYYKGAWIAPGDSIGRRMMDRRSK